MKIVYIFLIYIIIDYIYLGIESNQKMYNSLVQNIQNENIVMNYYYAGFSYLIMTLSFNHFVKNQKDALMIGFSLYGLWNCVNGAIFKNWSLTVSIKDTLWGMTLNFILFKILNIFKLN